MSYGLANGAATKGANITHDASVLSPVADQVDNLQRDLARIADMVNTLGMRLSPVLVQQPPTTAADRPGGCVPVPLVESLLGLHVSALTIEQQLADLMSRLAI